MTAARPLVSWRDFWSAHAAAYRRSGPDVFHDYLEARPELFVPRSMREVGGIVTADALDARARAFAATVASFLDLVAALEPGPGELEEARRKVTERLGQLSGSELGGVVGAIAGALEAALEAGEERLAAAIDLVLHRVLIEARARDPDDAAAVAEILLRRFRAALAAGETEVDKPEKP